MVYDPTTPGVTKATLNTLQTLIQANVTNLNSSITADTDISAIIATTAGQPGLVTTSHVLRGDRYTPWDLPNNGPIRIHIVPGGNLFTATRPLADASRSAGFQYTITMTIHTFVHQRLFAGLSEELQQDRVCTVLTICGDWLRAGVFNNVTNRSITIDSSEYSSAGDKLVDCSLESGSMGIYPFGYGKDEIIYENCFIFSGKIR